MVMAGVGSSVSRGIHLFEDTVRAYRLAADLCFAKRCGPTDQPAQALINPIFSVNTA
jgi:hypothetical protein